MDIQNLILNLISWFSTHGVRIIIILITANLINYFFRSIIKKAVEGQIKNKISKKEKRKRIETLIAVFDGTLKFLVWIAAFLMILTEFRLEIAPLLAGIGVAGLAIGMAAKDIISDFIAGLFIIIEDQYRIGDKVKISHIEGVVEEITLRRTIIKSEDGLVHSIPNSRITIISKES